MRRLVLAVRERKHKKAGSALECVRERLHIVSSARGARQTDSTDATSSHGDAQHGDYSNDSAWVVSRRAAPVQHNHANDYYNNDDQHCAQ